MSWLFVANAGVVSALDQRRMWLANPEGMEQRRKWHADALKAAIKGMSREEALNYIRDEFPIRAIRGDFGGGGSAEEWERSTPEADAESFIFLMLVGDPGCPPEGNRRVWKYWTDVVDRQGVKGSYTPINRAPFTHFMGFSYQGAWRTNPPPHAWLGQVDNCPPFDPNVAYSAGGPPGCTATSTASRCSLPDPYETGNWPWVERWTKPLPTGAPVGGLDPYEHTYGAVWAIYNESCVPEHFQPVLARGSPRHHNIVDRYAKKPVRHPKEEERDKGILPIPPFIVPPPFVFGVVPGAPAGRPEIEEGGFRPRKRPRRKTRERKKYSTVAKIFKVLDALSESAEVVDCVFDSLPKPVQKKWKKDRPNRGLLDTAGQYGIDGADWKAQALWHNHKQVDWNKAFLCITANQIEDMIIGRLQRHLPKGASTAISRGYGGVEYLRRRDQDKAKWARIRRENAARVRAAAAKRKAA